MAQTSSGGGSGGIVPLYGVVIRDKCKSADPATLRAYKVVAEDMLKTAKGGADVDDLRASLKDLDAALQGK
jgi:hypothetical protein